MTGKNGTNAPEGVTTSPAPATTVVQPALQDTGAANVENVFAEVLAEVLGVDHVDADKHFFDDLGADSMVMARFCARIRKLDGVPTVAMKDVYAGPTIAQLAAVVAPPKSAPTAASPEQPAASGEDLERVFAGVLAEVLKVDHVETDKHFFDDLGADSMVMARFCARIRKLDDVPEVAMKDVYAGPTIAQLAAMVSVADSVPEASEPSTPAEPARKATNGEVALCGALQFAATLAYFYVVALVLTFGYRWVADGADYAGIFGRSAVFMGGGFVLFSVLPILAKWVLVGRWTAGEFRIWSFEYLRFWIVRTLIRANPLVLFAGTPIYVAYLRALGARIGKNVVIHSQHVPVCTDLLTIDEDAVIRKDSYFNCYRAHAGFIQTGHVSLGKNSLVGEMTVLDIETSLGEGAQIGHSSALHAGQSIPANEHRFGSPAEQKTAFDYRDIDALECGMARKAGYCLASLLPALVIPPIALTVIVVLVGLLSGRPHFEAAGLIPFLHLELYYDALLVSAVLFFGALVVGLAFIGTVPRLLNLALEPGKTYALYGLHYGIHQLIAGFTNSKFFNHLFGDSSYIVNYQRWIGYDFPDLVQTGSNFGMDQKHDNPFLVTVGGGTVIADGLSVINSDYSSTSFRVLRATIGRDNFLGNFVAYPAHGKTGDNCLLATKVMVPVEGEIREGVGLLGSPSFSIPRSVARDRELELNDDEEQARRLAVKNRHNLVTMGVFLAVHWFEIFLLACIGFSVVELYASLGTGLAALVAAVAALCAVALRIGYYILVERLSTGFQALQPQECSIYYPYFWFHERYWKMMMTSAQLKPLDGTPFKGFAWRLLGVNIGRRVFDDGCGMTERTMVAIGDDCTLNLGTIIQPHSQEDGGFKSDRIKIGAGCTLGVAAWVHYGATLGDGAVLAPNAFVMKGEEVTEGSYWAENPAREISGGLDAASPHGMPAVAAE